MENVIQVVNGPYKQNAFIYICNAPHCIVIDPGLDYEPIREILEHNSLQPEAIFCTHGHFDHIGSVCKIKKQYNSMVYLHSKDMKICNSSNFLLKVLKTGLTIETPIPDVLISSDAVYQIRGVDVHVICTPGHTPGSCTIRIGGLLFTGDTFLKTENLKNQLPGFNEAELQDSFNKIFTTYPGNYMVYPGHGKPEKLEVIKTGYLIAAEGKGKAN